MAYLMIDSLFRIQTCLLTKQIIPLLYALRKKNTQFFSLIPLKPIHIQPQGITLQSSIQLPQTIQKYFLIPLRLPQGSFPLQQRGYRSKKIQSLTMLARGRNPKPFSPLAPTQTKSRIRRKIRFFLINKHLVGLLKRKFFLPVNETSWLAWSWPANKNNWPFSNDTQTGVPKSAPAEHLFQFRKDALNKPAIWDHLGEPSLGKSLHEIAPILFLNKLYFYLLILAKLKYSDRPLTWRRTRLLNRH